ncbi:MAG: hypothetical protein HKN32_04840 [Flavobacteriales bacterium]|nr:hypothetical protein [Flavobacteriales bacterium]
MLSFIDPLKLSLSEDYSMLEVKYQCSTDSPLFDICDLQGRIIKSGKLSTNEFKIKVSDLVNQMYIFLILDGETIRSKKFKIKKRR